MASSIRGAHLHFDGASGAAGDMTLGALIDLGVPTAVICQAMAAMKIDPARLQVTKVFKKGIAAVDVKVVVEEPEHGHGSGSGHYPYAEIRKTLEQAEIASAARHRAFDIFERIARAEAKIHGTTLDGVVFHEVGAIDSITDVVGSALALDWLAPLSISAEPVVTGRGSVDSAHGRLPLPSPAALEIMSEAAAPIHRGAVERELLTPTGAAILAHAVNTWGPVPALVPIAVGYGAGDCDLPDRANLLRVTAGRRHPVGDESEPLAKPKPGGLVEISTNIDDMGGELCGHVAEALFDAGAVDVWWTPLYMKKGRPAVLLSVLCEPWQAEICHNLILRETTAIGVRFHQVSRVVAERELVATSTPYGEVQVKVARMAGTVVNVAPEFSSCRARARECQVAVKEVMIVAQAACRALLHSQAPS